MHILFLDETARQENRTKREFFSICGVMVAEKELLKLNNSLEELKDSLGLSNFKDLKENRIKKLSAAEKLQITQTIAGFLKANGATIRSIVIGSHTLKNSGLDQEAMYFGAIDFLLERFFLDLSKTDGSCGMVVFDTVDTRLQIKLRKRFYSHIRTEGVSMHGKPRGVYKDCIYPVLVFTEDEHSVILQTADLVATSLNSALTKSLRENDYFDLENLNLKNEFLNIYWPLFKRDFSGKVAGWGIKVWN